jgi:hypothetical protein
MYPRLAWNLLCSLGWPSTYGYPLRLLSAETKIQNFLSIMWVVKSFGLQTILDFRFLDQGDSTCIIIIIQKYVLCQEKLVCLPGTQ